MGLFVRLTNLLIKPKEDSLVKNEKAKRLTDPNLAVRSFKAWDILKAKAAAAINERLRDPSKLSKLETLLSASIIDPTRALTRNNLDFGEGDTRIIDIMRLARSLDIDPVGLYSSISLSVFLQDGELYFGTNGDLDDLELQGYSVTHVESNGLIHYEKRTQIGNGGPHRSTELAFQRAMVPVEQVPPGAVSLDEESYYLEVQIDRSISTREDEKALTIRGERSLTKWEKSKVIDGLYTVKHLDFERAEKVFRHSFLLDCLAILIGSYLPLPLTMLYIAGTLFLKGYIIKLFYNRRRLVKLLNTMGPEKAASKLLGWLTLKDGRLDGFLWYLFDKNPQLLIDIKRHFPEDGIMRAAKCFIESSSFEDAYGIMMRMSPKPEDVFAFLNKYEEYNVAGFKRYLARVETLKDECGRAVKNINDDAIYNEKLELAKKLFDLPVMEIAVFFEQMSDPLKKDMLDFWADLDSTKKIELVSYMAKQLTSSSG